MMMGIVLRTSLVALAQAFPESADPRMIEGPFETGQQLCTAELIPSTALKAYSQIVVSPFRAPSCLDEADIAIIELAGTIGRGRQFDRYGAAWFAGIEVLRTTTPEPNSERQIQWRVERDVTDYLILFRSCANSTNAPCNSTLSIPNQVTDVYTGVLEVNLTLHLYRLENQSTAAAIIPLLSPAAATNPWEIMKVGSSKTTIAAVVQLPFTNSYSVVLDVFASGHSCDEFWYTNVPGPNSNEACGGGAFREIQVAVDGVTAAVSPPFPVIYSGGICPLAWRPLAGVASFNIPPYRMDLSAFATILNDGVGHNITVTVVDSQGAWYVDPVLLAWRDERYAKLDGGVVGFAESPLSVVVLEQNFTGHQHYVTQATHSVSTTGELRDSATGALIFTTTVNYVLSTVNDNVLVETSDTVFKQIVTARMGLKVNVSTYSALDNVSTDTITVSDYPIFVQLYQRGNDYIDSNISLSRKKQRRVVSKKSGALASTVSLEWTSAINASATLTGESDGGADYGKASTSAYFRIRQASDPCFERNSTAVNGSISHSYESKYNCTVPSSWRFCGLDVCSTNDVPFPILHTTVSNGHLLNSL